MSKVYTNWSQATQNPQVAMISLLSALDAGKNAWIEKRNNGEQEYPILIKNPLLDDWRNWTMKFGVLRSWDGLISWPYFNDTEKELTEKFTACFGTKKAMADYYERGILSKDNFIGHGVCHAVRITDICKFINRSYPDDRSAYWATIWQPNDGIPHWVPANIGHVFVVCYNEEPLTREFAQKQLTCAVGFLFAQDSYQPGGLAK